MELRKSGSSSSSSTHGRRWRKKKSDDDCSEKREEKKREEKEVCSSPEKGKGFLFQSHHPHYKRNHFFQRRSKTVSNSDHFDDEEMLIEKEERKRARHRNRSERFEAHIRPGQDYQGDSSHFYSVSCEDLAESLPSKGVLVKGLMDLPPDIHDSLKRMKFENRVLEENFEILLNILSFADKHIPRRRFVTKNQLQILKNQKKQNLPTISDRILLKPSEAYETLSFSKARKRFKWDKYMGSGGFGQVVAAKCRHKKSELYGQKVALKFQGNCTDREQVLNLAEVSLLKFCEHPNIVKIHQALDVGLEVWIIIELVKGCNLNRLATNKSSPFTEPEIARVARKVLNGLKYLHDNQIAHRDLKNMNIMLSVTGEVKIIDFGLAIDMALGKRIQMVGSPFYMAPEMVRGEPHSFEVDVWAFVVSMLELANQKSATVGNVKRAMFLVATVGLTKRFRKKSTWSDEFKDFIDQGATIDPAARPSVHQLLEHDFLRKSCSSQSLRKKLEPIFFVDAFNGTGMGSMQ